MKIIVADRHGIVGVQVRAGSKKALLDPREARIVVARRLSEVEEEVRGGDRHVVVCAELIHGFKSVAELARRVKTVNPNIVFCAYNGIYKELGLEIDLHIPSTPKGHLAGDWVLSSIMKFLEDRRLVFQPSLF
jgi:hypothetical protein